jgi:hypothetical protein
MNSFRCALVTFCLLTPSVSFAQAISGTLTGSHNGYDEYGTPKVDYAISLACSLTCGPTAPTLHYRARSGVNWNYASAPSESAGSVGTAVSYEIDMTGQYKATLQGRIGTATRLIAPAVTCECGGRIGEGGYIDLSSQPIVIPPGLGEPFLLSGNEHRVAITAKPRGGETVDVHISGAGLDVTKSISEADFAGNDGFTVPFFPTQEGAVTIVATLMPWSSSKTISYGVGTGGTSSSKPDASTTGSPNAADSSTSKGCAVGTSPSFGVGLLLLSTVAARRRKSVVARQ